jgi:sugar phosphate isomerase/epimerase
MRLGISSFAFGWAVGIPGYPPPRPLGPVRLVERAAALGLDLVQFGDNLPLHALPPGELDALEARAGELGMGIEVGMRGLGRGILLDYLALARRFGSPFVRVMVGTPGAEPSDYERAGVRLALENFETFRAAELAEIVRRVGPPAGVCLDTVNSAGALEGPEVVVEALAPLTVNLHVKDYIIRRPDHRLGFLIEGRPAGQGQLDIPWLLEMVRGNGHDPSVVLEQWTPPEATVAETIVKEERWAAESVRYMRLPVSG